MIGLAGSQGPWISFLYLWRPISHQQQIPIHSIVKLHPSITPVTNAVRPPPVRVTNTPPHAAMVRKMVRTKWLSQEWIRSCLRKMGKRPKISIEKRVKEKTCVVDGNLDASTAEAIMAEFVDMEVGSLYCTLDLSIVTSYWKHTVHLAHHCNQRTPHSSKAATCLEPRLNHSLWSALVT